jgi:crotonobetainyl-CoA:carnitine CoA-transferase CaiB-like acyl-CoA transferase
MLSDITVLEFGARVSTGYCGKLLRDAGARVIKVEPPAGDPLRAAEPAYAAYLHGGKLSVTVPAGLERAAAVARLADDADLVVCDDDDAELVSLIMATRARRAGLLVIALSDYGLDGPAAGNPATDFTLQAEAGISLLHPTGDRPPVAAGVELSELAGGAAAAMGAVTALVYAEAGAAPTRTASGTTRAADADVSRFEAVITLLQYPWLYRQIPGHNPYPLPQNAVPGLELALDGWVCAVAVTPPQWTDFKRMAGVAELEDARFDTLSSRIENAAETTALIRRFTMQHTVDELVELGAEYRVPITPVGTPLSLPSLVPYAQRGAFVETSEGVSQPRSPFRYEGFSGTPAPLSPVGKHDGPSLRSSRRLGQPVLPPPGDPAKPLAGLRVLEIGTFQAGPIVGTNLAALGADVIKIEAVSRPDLIRFSGRLTVPRSWERAAGFIGPNLGKRELTADFTQPEGLHAVQALVARADVVIDNFLPRVLDDRGLDYESIAALRPGIVMLRLPAWGLHGAWRNRPGFTYSVDATSGLSDLTGYPDGDPLLTGTIIDPLAAIHSTMIMLAAIRHRRLTGEGGLIEVPLCDVAAQLTARAVVTASSTGAEPVRSGNHSTTRSPQGIYRCADGTWLAISVADDRQWAALAGLEVAAEWGGDDRFAHLAGRVEYRFELDERLTAICATHEAAGLETRLRRAGVPAAVLGVGLDFAEHPQLIARGRIFETDHAIIGRAKYLGVPVRYAAAPAAWAPSGTPLFGEHNTEILTELGYSAGQIRKLTAAGLIGDVPFGKPPGD